MGSNRKSTGAAGNVVSDALTGIPEESIISLAEQYGPSFGRAFAGFIQEMARASAARGEAETRRPAGAEDRSDSDHDPVGSEIRKRIRESGRSMKDIAAAMKKDPSAISKLIKRGTNAKYETLAEIAHVLGLDVVELLSGRESPRPAS